MRFREISYPIHLFRIQYLSGEASLAPLLAEGVRYEEGDPEVILPHFQSLLQGYIDEFGALDFLLDEYALGEYTPLEEEVTVAITKVGNSKLDVRLRLPAYYRKQGNVYFAFLPLPFGSVMASTLNELKRRMHLFVAMSFHGLSAEECVDQLIEILWVQQVSVEQVHLQLRIPHPTHANESNQVPPPELLDRAAPVFSLQESPLFERAYELLQLKRAMQSSKNRLILLVGTQGVGKTSLVHAYVRDLQDGEEPHPPVRETTAARLMQSLQQGMMGWQQGLAMLLRELQQHPCTLYIRSYAELFEVGIYQGNTISIGQYLRPYMERGELSLLAECTPEQKARLELQHPSILQLFQVIHLEEQEPAVLEQVVDQWVQHAGFRADPVAIRTLLSLQTRYMPFAGYPGKTIRTLERVLQNLDQDSSDPAIDITENEVVESFCMETGLPSFLVNRHIPMDESRINGFFQNRIFGQEPAVQALVGVLAKIKTGLSKSHKPIASLLFTGSTGVGKTAAARALAELVFGDADRMIRFDMSEYSSPWQVQTLIGSPYQPDSEGKLTSAVRRLPFSIVLFDEIDKADSSFFDFLLQILDEGRLTDHTGRLTSFCGSIIILTSNLGAQRLRVKPVRLGTSNAADEAQQQSEGYIQAARQALRPELFNRFDEIIPFQALSKAVVESIVSRELELIRQREGLLNRPYEWRMDDSVVHWISEKGYHPDYGARHLQRSIREHLVLPLSTALNQFDPSDMLSVSMEVRAGSLHLEVEEHEQSGDNLMAEYDRMIQANFANRLQQEVGQFVESSLVEAIPDEVGTEIAEQLVQLTQEVDHLAKTLSLCYLQRQPLPEGIYEQLRAQKELLTELKFHAVAATTSEYTHACTLLLIGHDVRHLLSVYEFILEAKSYAYSVHLLDLQHARHPALRLLERNELASSEAGAVIQVFGNLADLYFSQEGGKHEITGPDGRVRHVQILVEKPDYTPDTSQVLAAMQQRMKSGEKVIRRLEDDRQLRYYEGNKRKTTKLEVPYEHWLLEQLDAWLVAEVAQIIRAT